MNSASVISFADTQSGLLTRARLDKGVGKQAGELDIQAWTVAKT